MCAEPKERRVEEVVETGVIDAREGRSVARKRITWSNILESALERSIE